MSTVADRGELFVSLSTHVPDVVLLDGDVVERDGGLLGELRSDQRWHDVRVIVTAPWGDLEEGSTTLPWGADDCVSKPFRVPELLGRVRTQLRASSQLRAARSALRDTTAELERTRVHAASNRRLVDILHEVTGELSAAEIYRLLAQRVSRSLNDLALFGGARTAGRRDGDSRRRGGGSDGSGRRDHAISISRDRRRARDRPAGARGGREGASAVRVDAREAGSRRPKLRHPFGRDGPVHGRPLAIRRAVHAHERRRARADHGRRRVRGHGDSRGRGGGSSRAGDRNDARRQPATRGTRDH